MERTVDPLNTKEVKRDKKHWIYAVDPGVTTGLSLIGFDKPCSPTEVKVWGSNQISYGGSGNASDLISGDAAFAEQRICHQIADNVLELARSTSVFLVIEDFIIRRSDSSRDFLSPVRITSGILQSIFSRTTEDHYPITVFFQQPSEAKGTCTDERLDKWGFEIRTQKDRHSRDADRHGILLLRKFVEKPQKLHLQTPMNLIGSKSYEA